MNKLVLSVITLALLSSHFASADETFDLSSVSGPEQAAVQSLLKAQALKGSIASFLRIHALEITREENFSQEGSIDGSSSGSLSGGGRMGYLGNFPKLASGLLQTAFGPAATMPLGLIAQGLAGIGFGSMSIKGESSGTIHGEIHAKGQKINDDAHLYLIPAKEDKTIAAVILKLKVFKAEHPGQKTDLATGELLSDLNKLIENPYFVTVDELKSFESKKLELQDEINNLDEIISAQVASKSEVYNRIQVRVEIIKEWIRSKRYQVKTVGGLEGDYSITAVADWKLSIPNPKDCAYLFNRSAWDRYLGFYADGNVFIRDYEEKIPLACNKIKSTEINGVVAGSVKNYLNSNFLVTTKNGEYYTENQIKVSDHVKMTATTIYPIIRFDAKKIKDIVPVIMDTQTRESRLGDL